MVQKLGVCFRTRPEAGECPVQLGTMPSSAWLQATPLELSYFGKSWGAQTQWRAQKLPTSGPG